MPQGMPPGMPPNLQSMISGIMGPQGAARINIQMGAGQPGQGMPDLSGLINNLMRPPTGAQPQPGGAPPMGLNLNSLIQNVGNLVRDLDQ